MDKVNPNGGAISISHPNAASGSILVAKTARGMYEKDLSRGLITFCLGNGHFLNPRKRIKHRLYRYLDLNN